MKKRTKVLNSIFGQKREYRPAIMSYRSFPSKEVIRNSRQKSQPSNQNFDMYQHINRNNRG